MRGWPGNRGMRLAVADAIAVDLTQGPLLRAKLWCLDLRSLAALTTHHIVSDNWSMQFCFGTLSRLWGFFAGQPSPLAEVSFNMETSCDSSRNGSSRRKWNTLPSEGATGRRNGFHYVPPDHADRRNARPETAMYHGAHERLTLDRSLTNALKTLSPKEKVSPSWCFRCFPMPVVPILGPTRRRCCILCCKSAVLSS